jgi:hypothetical protein
VRAVKAKKLRRLARQMMVGKPERALMALDTIKKVKVTNREHKDFGKTIDVRMVSAVNDPHTVRGRYRELKRIYK